MKNSNNIRELTILTGLLIINLIFSFAVYSEEQHEIVPQSHVLTYLLGTAGAAYFLNNRAYQKNLKLKESIQAKEAELNNLKSIGREGLTEKCLPYLKKIAFNLNEREQSLLAEVEESNKNRWFKLNTPAPRTLKKEEITEDIKVLEEVFKDFPQSYIEGLKLDGALSPLGKIVQYPVNNGLSKAVSEQLARLSNYKIIKLAKLPYDIVYWFSKQLGAWVVMPFLRGAMKVPLVSGTVFIIKDNHSLAVLIGAFLLGDYLDDKRDAQSLKAKELLESLKVLEDANDPTRQKLETNLLDAQIKSNASQNFFNLRVFKSFWEKTEGLGQNFESGDTGLGKFPFEISRTGYALNSDVVYLDKLYESAVHKYIQKIRNTPEAKKITSGSATYKLVVKEVFVQILVEKASKELEKHFGKDYLNNPEFTKFVEATLDKYVEFLNSKPEEAKKEDKK